MEAVMEALWGLHGAFTEAMYKTFKECVYKLRVAHNYFNVGNLFASTAWH